MSDILSPREMETTRQEAERCKYQRGSQGVWARKWLALYATMRTLLEAEPKAVTRG